MAIIDGVGVCAGVTNPRFVPKEHDFPNAVFWQPYGDTWPATTGHFGTFMLYSNEDELVKFYLQATSKATENIISNYLRYTDGYAVRYSVNFQPSYLFEEHTWGWCVTSQLYGSSCFTIKPRGTTASGLSLHLEDIKSYYMEARNLRSYTGPN